MGELLKRMEESDLPSKFILTKPLGKEHFKFHNNNLQEVRKFVRKVIQESMNEVENIINLIDSYPKKIKINKPYVIYDDGIETAISNSAITKFYTRYQREVNKKYIKSIPLPFERLSNNIKRFNKLNQICKIYQKYTDVELLLCKAISLNLMDIILFDMYFDVKSRNYNVYDVVDNLNVPNENNKEECVKFAKWFTDKENPVNYIIFYSLTDDKVKIITDSI